MKVEQIQINCENACKDGDYVSKNNYVVITSDGEIIRNGKLLKIKGNYSTRYPRVKIISDLKFLLIEGDSHGTKVNAWVLNNNGEIEDEFYLGSVNKLEITTGYIIASYYDSHMGSIDSQWRFPDNQIVVFDHSGKKVYGFNEEDKPRKKVDLQENYAFLKKDDHTIYFIPYPEFSIIELDLRTFEHRRVLSLPEVTQEFYPRVFSKKGNDWYFVCPDYSNDIESKHCTYLVKLNSDMTLETLEQFDHHSIHGKGISPLGLRDLLRH